jgi:multidrug efflux pump subunit AcrB
MKNTGLSYNSRKALIINIGESAGTEIANLISQMAAEIEELRRTKVSVTKIVPTTSDTRDHFVEEPI